MDLILDPLLNNSYGTVLVIIVLSFLYIWYRRPPLYPPGPRGLPIVGIVPFLSKSPERDFAKWGNKYGPLMVVPMAWQNWLVLSDYDIIMEALVKNSDAFYERPYLRFLSMLTKNGVVFSTGGERWKSHRKFGSIAIKNASKGVLERKINEETRYLAEELQKFEGKPFQIQHMLTKATCNIISNMALGSRFDYDDSRLKVLVKCVLDQFSMLSHWKSNVVTFLPFLCDIPPFSWHVSESVQIFHPMRELITEFVEEHKSTYDPKDIRNILDGYLEQFRNETNNFNLKDCQDFFIDLFVAGTETSATTLWWGILCLIIHTEVQEKMQKEIDDVIGKDGIPSMIHRRQMPYSCAVMHEIMRFRTLLSLSLPRCVANDVTIRGYRIPKGTNVITNLWNVHNDDTHWKNPEEFIPERHLDADGAFTNSRHVLSFGAGARVCLGEQVARTQVWLFLVSIVQKFELSFDPEDCNPPTLDCGSTALVNLPDKYNMIVKSR